MICEKKIISYQNQEKIESLIHKPYQNKKKNKIILSIIKTLNDWE